MPPDDRPELSLPAGSRIDLDELVAVATWTNVAHRLLGTRLLAVERHGVTIGVDWREDLVADVGTAALMSGLIACLVDHACSLAVHVGLDGAPAYGGTIGLRVDHLGPLAPRRGVHARAETHRITTTVAHARAWIYHPEAPTEPVATGVCSVMLRDRTP
jgi:acyl-coenzyme A thioesterase PaaI-like protein